MQPAPARPTAREVLRRTLCLAAFVLRGEIEQAHMVLDRAEELRDVRELAESLNQWLLEEGLVEDQTAEEAAAFSHKPGTWPSELVIEAAWWTESLGTLLWALSLVEEMPPFDLPFDQAEVLRSAAVLRPIQEPEARAVLRPAGELDYLRELAELWLWRARLTRLSEEEDPPPERRVPADEVIREVAKAALELGNLPYLVEGDFEARGKAYRDLSAEEYLEVGSLAMERHIALTWLTGEASSWQEARGER